MPDFDDAGNEVFWSGEKARSRSTSSEPLPRISDIRAQLQRDQQSSDKVKVEAANLKLAALNATTDAERHKSIRRLPVTVTESAATDGRAGVVKSFFARGKERLRLFVPTDPRAVSESSADHLSRPMEESAALEEECFEGEPGPCSTSEEMEDLAITVAYTQAEIAYQTAVFEGAYQGGGEEEVALSGPSACNEQPSCAEHAARATLALGGAIAAAAGAVDKIQAAAAAGKTLAAAARVNVGASMLVAGFATGWFVGSYVDCLALMYGD